MPSSGAQQHPPGEPAARPEGGEQVTLFITAEVEAHYEPWEGDENRTMRIRVPGLARPVLVAYEAAGITLVRGDIRSRLVSALKHAVVMVEPVTGCKDCSRLRPSAGQRCDACAEDARLRVEYGELLAAIQETSGTEGDEGE
jgi:hypothetical protein